MTYAIFSIVANQVSTTGCSAYTYQQYSYSPYIRAPFHQFSEQLDDDFTTNGGTHPAFPFLTGHGGANQAVLFGYLGLRYLPGDTLFIDPNLPPQIPLVKYRTFYWHGWPISSQSNYTHTTISRATKTTPLTTADSNYNCTSIKLQVGSGSSQKSYSLPADGSAVVVPNRQIASVNTVSGNLVQCQPAASSDGYQPGQFPFSVNDGAASTKWQPSFANNVSSITITVPESAYGKTVYGFYFDWAQAPPSNATVVFHNASITTAYNLSTMASGAGEFASPIPVSVSNPWSPQSASNFDIGVGTGTTTNFTLPIPVSAPKYATLLIYGNQGLDKTDIQYQNGTGATVAEWAILSM